MRVWLVQNSLGVASGARRLWKQLVSSSRARRDGCGLGPDRCGGGQAIPGELREPCRSPGGGDGTAEGLAQRDRRRAWDLVKMDGLEAF